MSSSPVIRRPVTSSAAGAARRLARLSAAAALVLAMGLPATVTAGSAPTDELSDDRLTQLGQFFETADDHSRDLPRALDLYCRAAARAHPEAISRLGWLYAKGVGVELDDAVAATMFRWAAALGHASVDSVAAAMAGSGDTPAPCLVQHGIESLTDLRAVAAGSSLAQSDIEADEATPVVENPAQFRTRPPPAEHQRLVQMVVKEAGRFKLDPRLVVAVIQTESSFNARARSSKNAQGLMQLIPDTARRFNVRNPNDPRQNLRGGMAYLRWLLDYYHGDVVLALAAYNSGEGTVNRYKGVPPFRETIAYVQRIRALYPFDRHPFESNTPAVGHRAWVVDGMATAGLPTLSQAQ